MKVQEEKDAILLQESGAYQEEIQEQMLQGQGSFDFPDGAHYEGEFDQGQMHGQGTFNWPGGEQYVGEFRNGKRQGQGRYLIGAEAEEVEYYQGEWNQDRYH